jgi:outer membrane protein OmpA-like peptidoglycan-associated protein
MKKNLFLLILFVSTFVFAQQQQSRFLIKNLKINNKFQNFGTTFYGNEKNKVIYSSQDSKNSLLDLYIGDISKDGEIINSKKLQGLNTKSYESNVTFSKDGKTVYFTRSLYGKSNTIKKDKNKLATIAIFKADVTSGGKWVNVEPLSINGNFDVGHPTLNKDNTKMYFTSNMPGGFGSTDIYVVDINPDGSFGLPKNMGEKVNSKYKEMFPAIDENNVLFFSSNRPDEGHGGLDIYAVKIYEDKKISDRLHLEPPVNSIADDFSYIFDHDKKRGYFSSNRDNGVGSDDIYFFTETRPLLFDCYQKITGNIIDGTTKTPIAFAEVVLQDGNGQVIEKQESSKKGDFTFEKAVCDTPYKLFVKKRHYGEALKEFITKSKHNGQTAIAIELYDSFIVKKRGIRMLNIDDINFDFDSDKIRPDAANQLDRVVNIMNRYPKMVIELGTHSDSRGKDLYNLVLSNRRAKSVIRYIIEHGISPDRISGRGYGEKRLLNHCKNGVKCTEAEHEQNRRSEFVIVNM